MGPEGDALQKVESVRADVVALLREKRYEEALAALYRARSESPSDRELQKGIDKLKEFLVGAYAKRLGGLDRVALPIPLSSLRSPDAVLLARYVDGNTTFGDVAQMCPLGKLRALQVLVGLYAGREPPRIDADPPNSGLRLPDWHAEAGAAPGRPAEAASLRVEAGRPAAGDAHGLAADDGEVPTPDTARSAAVAAIARQVQADSTGRYEAIVRDEAAVRDVEADSARGDDEPVVREIETEETRRYKEAFARGAAAFVQRRYADAVEAFEACAELRPGDRAAEVMLRRSLREVESR